MTIYPNDGLPKINIGNDVGAHTHSFSGGNIVSHGHGAPSTSTLNNIIRNAYDNAIRDQIYAERPLLEHLKKMENPMTMAAKIAAERAEARERARIEGMYAAYEVAGLFDVAEGTIISWKIHNEIPTEVAHFEDGIWRITGHSMTYGRFEFVDWLIARDITEPYITLEKVRNLGEVS